MDRHCPLCKSYDFKIVKDKNGFRIVKCAECKHLYVKNPKNDSTSGFNNDVNIENYKKRHIYIHNFLQNYFRNTNRTIKIAEIGSGYGHLANIISNTNTFDYIGFEPSKTRAQFCQAHNLNVVNQEFEKQQGFFDAVILDNVLEHVLHPIQLLEATARSINKAGCVIVIVPNRFDVRRFSPKWRKRHYWQPHCHVSYFCFEDLKFIGKNIGLEFMPFDLHTLGNGLNILQKIKTMLDGCGIYVGGLYTFAVKTKSCKNRENENNI